MAASSSASSFFMSILGNSVSPFCTFSSAGSTPHVFVLSQAVASPSVMLYCAQIFSGVLGMKG